LPGFDDTNDKYISPTSTLALYYDKNSNAFYEPSTSEAIGFTTIGDCVGEITDISQLTEESADGYYALFTLWEE
jgi:hypothetical protein